MIIGIPKERRPHEYRAGLSPAGVRLLVQDGHACFVEKDAGRGAGFRDEEYQQAGGRIVYSGEEAYGRADLVLKVARPTPAEMEWLVSGQMLMGYLYLTVANPDKVRVLLEKKVSSLAYEQIQNEDGSYPVLKPLSQIGGRMAAQLAAGLLQNNTGGKGVVLGGAPGVPPAEVAIIGGGTVGENAVQAFLGMGAQVTVLDVNLARLQALDSKFQGRIVTLVAYPFNLERVCAYADVVVGAVRGASGRAPVVITRPMLRKMRPGAVLLDLSIDEGGCAETSRPTTHENPVYTEEGVRHCCIPNLPGVVARTATHAFLNAAWPFIKQIANHGLDDALAESKPLARSLVTHHGALREPGSAAFPTPPEGETE